MREKELFEGISKKHLYAAIKLIDKEGYPPSRRSSYYDLVNDKVTYPPKYILSLAGYIRDGNFISRKLFKGGEKSAAFDFLRLHEFSVKPKVETNNLKHSKANTIIENKYNSMSTDPSANIDYFKLQESVFQYLMKKHEKDPNFRFSLRKSFNEATKKNYFIGTEKSKYFAFSLWYIFNGFPGASIDPLVFVIYLGNNKLHLKIQMLQTNSPDDKQNELVLELVKNITPGLKKIEDPGYLLYPGSVENKMFKTEFTENPNEFYNENDLLSALDKLIGISAPIIDKELLKIKKNNSEFIAERITNDQFKKMLDHVLKKRGEIIKSKSSSKESDLKIESLNQILFGPPGTGKTYNTVNEALKIVDNDFYRLHSEDRKKLTGRFRDLLINDWENPKGQIAFCTFHQSFTYEDFVEGIKPVKPITGDTYLKYAVEPGIFKRICRLSEDSKKAIEIKEKSLINWNEDTFKKAVFYKLSLGNSQDSEGQAIYKFCIENNLIAMGYGDQIDYSNRSESNIAEETKDLSGGTFAGQQLNCFIHYLKTGNYVVISNGNRYVRALGKITGDYHYIKESSIRYNHFRSVEWLFVDENIPINEIYNRNLQQHPMYKLDESAIKKDFFVHTHSSSQVVSNIPINKKDFVLIIDEINRGNVSSIFGELITLIEKDKRAEGDEELEVTLPYSKETFKVPANVYLVGTMNTADRSIEALDTALRRRFSFIEMPSKPSLVKDKVIEDIDLSKLLKTINKRIEKLIDKDHAIGHSHFLTITSKPQLIKAFENKILPLLQEYFFGDYGKIGLILGNSFIEKRDEDKFNFAEFNSHDDMNVEDLKERPLYKIKPAKEWDFISVYK